MTPTGLAFAAFLAVTLALHWALPRRAAVQNGVLLVASVACFASWSLEWVPLLAATTLATWGAALLLERGTPRLRRLALWGGILLHVAVLAWFKYRGFLLAPLLEALHAGGLARFARTAEFAVPIGLSYRTLIAVGYLLDVHHARRPAERSLLRVATFVTFFPQLVAGPITRASEMLPQLARDRRLAEVDFAAAGGALFTGWWMKAYLADWLAPAVVDPVFASAGTAGAAAHWGGLVGYALQVFCDFAGYSLLAIGLARLFAIELSANFDRPFLSRSMPEFWGRWHISLTRWLFDYLFGPMVTGAGALHGRVGTALVLVFALSGLWHGASTTFLVWGLLHGGALAAHHHWDAWYRARCRVDRRWVTARRSAAYAAGAWALTTAWFLGSLILFRSPDLGSALAFVRGLAGAGAGMPFAVDELLLVNGAAALVTVVAHHLEVLAPFRALRAWWTARPAPVIGIALGAALAWLLLFAPLARGSFIYAQF